MFGPKTSSTTPATSTHSTTAGKSSNGVTYDLCRRVTKDGKEKLENIGRVYIRSNGTGGVAFVKNGDGTEEQFPIFAKKAKPQTPKQDAAPAPAAVAA